MPHATPPENTRRRTRCKELVARAKAAEAELGACSRECAVADEARKQAEAERDGLDCMFAKAALGHEAAEARVVLLEAVVDAASRVVVCEQVEQFSEAQNDEIRGRANDLRKAFEALYLGSRGSGA